MTARISSDLCTDFKGTVNGDVEYVSLYVPVLKKNGGSGEGLPMAAPTAGIAYNPPGSKTTFATGNVCNFRLPVLVRKMAIL